MLKFVWLAAVAGSVLMMNPTDGFAGRWGRSRCHYSAPTRYAPAYTGNRVYYSNNGYVQNSWNSSGVPQVATGQGYRSFSVDPGSQPPRPLPLNAPYPEYVPPGGVYSDAYPPQSLSDTHNGIYLGADRKVRGLDVHH